MALWYGALVVYGRCFRTGWRKKYADMVPVPETLKERHEFLLKVRSKHVAHIAPDDTLNRPKSLSSSTILTRAAMASANCWSSES